MSVCTCAGCTYVESGTVCVQVTRSHFLFLYPGHSATLLGAGVSQHGITVPAFRGYRDEVYLGWGPGLGEQETQTQKKRQNGMDTIGTNS